MAFITYPLNNIDYTAEDAELFHCTRTSGIWAQNSFPISVTGADNNVTVGKGLAWINNEEFSGKVTALKSVEVLDMGVADGTYPRIDVVAIQFNANNNATGLVVKKGTPASTPICPAIVRTNAVYELYLASIYRPAGATAITFENITDLRMDKAVCGLMADSVTEIDTSFIEQQINALIQELEAEIDAIRNTTGLMFEAEWTENGVVTIQKGGTNADNAEESLSNLGGISKSLLWQNASPSSSFAEQAILLDLSKYEEVEVEFRHNNTSTQYFKERIQKGKMCRLLSFANTANEGAYMRFLARDATVNETSVAFTGATYKQVNSTAAEAASNVSNIPIAIYGIKGVK